jgi:hypothetical protein
MFLGERIGGCILLGRERGRTDCILHKRQGYKAGCEEFKEHSASYIEVAAITC